MDSDTCNALQNSTPAISTYDYSNISYGSTEIWKNLELPDYFKFFAYIIIIIGGLLGNISVILTVVLNKTMRTAINFYVTNLAVADLLVCIMCMVPEVFDVVTINTYILGRFMCKFHSFTEMVCLICSVLTLSAISCDRFFAILFPLRARAAKQRTSLLVTVIWIISIAVSIPLLFVRKFMEFHFSDFTMTQCGEHWAVYWYVNEATAKCEYQGSTMRYVYYAVVIITLYFLPVLIMITAYSSILWRVRKSEIPGEHIDDNINAHSRTRKKVNRMILFVLVAFIICWTPVQFTQVYASFFKQDDAPSEFVIEYHWASRFLAYANSFVNPFIYGAFNKTFREGFCNVLRCGCKRGQFGMSGLSRLTFISRFTSSRSGKSSKSQIGALKTSQKSNKDMELIHLNVNRDIPLTAGDTCVAIAEAR